MSSKTWTSVDDYIVSALFEADPMLDAVLKANRDQGLPAIDVSAAQGKLLSLLVRIRGAKTVLEVGTLGGYSTIWMARGLPADGKVVTLELEPRHAEVARRNFARAGLAEKIEVRVGRALGSLTMLAAEKAGPFDLIFIDADKAGIPEYFDWSLKLARPGTAIVVDNVVRKGEVADAASTDVAVRGVRRFNEMLAKERRVTATTIQTVGSKGYDGFTLAIVDAVA